ncbi:MAG: DNA polymerase III subunit chi [Alphaproteobacteria bacterium]
MEKEIRFYHLQRSTIDEALPLLVEKAYARGHRLQLLFAGKERAQHIDQLLWTYQAHSFLPHGIEGKDTPENQPIWLTTQSENANNANTLMVVDDIELLPATKAAVDFSLICRIFHGENPESLAMARFLWQQWKKDSTWQLSYWQQEDSGWQKKQ